jgi:hypothetical protein
MGVITFWMRILRGGIRFKSRGVVYSCMLAGMLGDRKAKVGVDDMYMAMNANLGSHRMGIGVF